MISHCIRPIETNQQTKFEVWYDNQKKIVNRPINPYFWSHSPLKNVKMCDWFKEEKILLSNRKKKSLLNYSFPSVRYVSAFRDPDFTMEDRIPFGQRVTIDRPEFYQQFQQPDKLKVMCLDFEMFSQGIFPRSSRDPIVGSGYQFSTLKNFEWYDEKPIIHLCKPKDEYKILIATVNDIIKHRPNLIVGYNINKFDMPYFIERLKHPDNRINIMQLSKDRTYPKFKYGKYTDEWGNVKYDRNKIINVQFGGITNVDLWTEVEMDQTLSGIKNRKMKTVAHWFKLTDDIRELDMTKMESKVMTQELHDYLLSDVIITNKLMKIYYPTMQTLSEQLKIPLNMVANRSWSHIPIIVHGRLMYENGYVGDKSNVQKYPHFNWYGNTFQGAIVEIFRKGLFDKVFQIDFKGYYPSTIVKFNLSPETCRFATRNGKMLLYKYNPNGFQFKMKKNKLHMIIPDANIGFNVYIIVDMDKDGSITEFLRKMRKQRDIAKISMKMHKQGTTNYIKLFSKQWTCKICENVQYGYNGTKFAIWGDLATAVATTGIDRYILGMVLNDWIPKYKIEADTDGIYIDRWIDIDSLNSLLNQTIDQIFGIDNDDRLILELDEYGKGYFYGMKNYVLEKMNGTLKIMGSAFKGKHRPKIFDKALEMVAKNIIFEDLTPKSPKHEIDKIYKECINMIFLEPLESFAMNVRLNKKNLWSYNETTMYFKLGQQVEEYYKINVEQGEQITYIKSKEGHKIIADCSKDDLDLKYYTEQIHKAFERLGFEEYIRIKTGRRRKRTVKRKVKKKITYKALDGSLVIKYK